MNKKVRVRYAPSPTGYLHIGGARSALFNYLFAKKYNGDFVFRIEDTDIERNIEGAEESQLHDLIWLNIIPDESTEKPNEKYGPYRQMEKLSLYNELAQELVKKGYAYECFCTSEELEQSRLEQEANGVTAFKYDRRCLHLTEAEKEELRNKGIKPSIRLKVPSNTDLTFNDLVRGEVKFNSDDFGDFVIIKSNGIPTYNFAVVVDDHFMEITHVLRGEEHLSNTPKQLMIYKYFGWEAPEFGHMTIIINENGKKLSKRDLNIMQFMSQYREKGYLPEAVFNFILLLGWTPAVNKEIFTIEEAMAEFDPARLSRSPSMFNNDHLNWMNSTYIKALDENKYLDVVKPFLLNNENLPNKDEDKLKLISLIYKSELTYLAQINDLVNLVLVKNENFDKNSIFTAEAKDLLLRFADLLEKNNLNIFDKESFKLIMNELISLTGLKGKNLYMPIRLALTGHEHGVELFNIINILGKEEAIKRLKEEA